MNEYMQRIERIRRQILDIPLSTIKEFCDWEDVTEEDWYYEVTLLDPDDLLSFWDEYQKLLDDPKKQREVFDY